MQDLEQRTWDVLDAAVEQGWTYVDAARSYGLAEQFLARWLAARPGVRVQVGSKWGYRYVGGWRLDADVHEVKDHSLAAFLEQRDESLALLDGALSVYHVHSATLDTGVLEDAAVHRALAGLRDAGTRVGISTSGAAQADAVRRALEVVVDGAPLFTSVQTTWNVLEPSAQGALAEAADAGAQVLVKEPVAERPAGARGSGHRGGAARARAGGRARRRGRRARPRRRAAAALGDDGAVRRGHAGAGAQQRRGRPARRARGRGRRAGRPRGAAGGVLGRALAPAVELAARP